MCVCSTYLAPDWTASNNIKPRLQYKYLQMVSENALKTFKNIAWHTAAALSRPARCSRCRPTWTLGHAWFPPRGGGRTPGHRHHWTTPRGPKSPKELGHLGWTWRLIVWVWYNLPETTEKNALECVVYGISMASLGYQIMDISILYYMYIYVYIDRLFVSMVFALIERQVLHKCEWSLSQMCSVGFNLLVSCQRNIAPLPPTKANHLRLKKPIKPTKITVVKCIKLRWWSVSVATWIIDKSAFWYLLICWLWFLIPPDDQIGYPGVCYWLEPITVSGW